VTPGPYFLGELLAALLREPADVGAGQPYTSCSRSRIERSLTPAVVSLVVPTVQVALQLCPALLADRLAPGIAVCRYLLYGCLRCDRLPWSLFVTHGRVPLPTVVIYRLPAHFIPLSSVAAVSITCLPVEKSAQLDCDLAGLLLTTVVVASLIDV
jgi:hypothetical protein